MSGKKKGGLSQFLYGTTKGKTIVNYGMSIGASVVIVGALFKIQHYPGASAMLVIGLGTEALLFLLGALEPQHLSTDWSKVYPELAHADEETDDYDATHEEDEDARIEGSDLPVTEQLDNMLQEAKIGPELIESLGTGLRGLKDTTERLADVSDASVATNEYVSSIRSAASNVGELSDTYAKAAESLTGLSTNSEAGASLGEHLSSMSSNLEQLNSTYSAQLEGSKSQLEATQKYFNGIEELLSSLNASVEDAKTYRSQMSELSNNISQLNTVYGNMLTAMSGNNNG